jgi:hypothetical protein
MVTTQWIPFYALALLRSLDVTLPSARRRRAAFLAGIFFAFNGLAEMITAVFLALFTLIVLLVQIRNAKAQRTVDGLRPVIPALLTIGVVSFLLWSPVLVPILVQFLTDDFSLEGWGEAIPLSTDLLGWFTPTVLHPVFGGDLVSTLRQVLVNWTLPGELATGFRDVNTVFLGWTGAALALLGALIGRQRVLVWIWTTLTFGLFTLGPFLQINGRYRFDLDGVVTSFPLPYTLLHYIPIVKANRAPNRNSVLLMLGLTVLVGYAIYWILRKVQHNGVNIGMVVSRQVASVVLASLFIFLLLFEHLALPLPLSDAHVPQVYELIAADPAPVSVMHAPLGWRTSFRTFGPERTLLQYYQSVHGKPMLGGNISRSPDFKMAYFERIPFFQAIVAVETGNELTPELAAAAAAQANELIYLYNVGYVLLSPPIPQRFPYVDTWQATWNFFKEILPLQAEPFWTGEGIEAYRVVQRAGEDRFRLNLGTAGTFPYRAEGWDNVEVDTPYGAPAIWATDEESCLLLPLRQIDLSRSTYALTAQIRPFDYPGSAGQRVTAWLNGHRLSTQELVNDWQTVSWTVSGSILRDSINRLCLDWGYTAVPRQVLGGDRSIGATGVALPVDVELKSFADGAWISLFDEETGEPVDASAGRRGVNVTVLDLASGEIVDRQGFDTAANVFESERLEKFLAEIPDGYPVLIASRGPATDFLTPQAVAGLRDLGADISLETLQGSYFAIIGVKGAEMVGTALQSIDANEAFLSVGLNADRRTLAAAVGIVEIE